VLPWSKDKDNIDRLTVGSMAKFTLATNASRNRSLLLLLRDVVKKQPKEVVPVLNEVIEAAETVDTARLRRDAMAAIEQFKRTGSDSFRKLSVWGQVGQTTLAAGCVVAAATGHIELGLPCILGGVTSSAALRLWSDSQ
jgi:hypothetical protein